MGLKVGFGEIVYLPPFWAELEAYLQVLEGVKWSSQLGGTDMLRKKHAKIYRSIDKIMREAWHMPQINFIMPFLELSDQLGLPTWKHKFDAALKGFRFLLRSEKEPVRADSFAQRSAAKCDHYHPGRGRLAPTVCSYLACCYC